MPSPAITKFREVRLARADGRPCTLHECQTCKAVVTDRHDHDQWHTRLGWLLAAATSKAVPPPRALVPMPQHTATPHHSLPTPHVPPPESTR